MPKPPSSRSTNSSSLLIDSSGFVSRSRPNVVVRSDEPGAEQNEPAPWVGYTARSSGNSSKR